MRILKYYLQLFRQETFDGNCQKLPNFFDKKTVKRAHLVSREKHNTWTLKIENCVKLWNAQIIP